MERARARLLQVLATTLVVIGGLLLSSYLGLACVHAGTLYDINQTSGAWLSFAFYRDRGVLYPPIFDGGYYAGTRYFPAFFTLHAYLARLTGELLVSGKLLTFTCVVASVSALSVITTRRAGGRLLGVAAASILLATYVGYKGALTIRGDVLPLASSLIALALLDGELRRLERPGSARLGFALSRAVWIAALLAGLAPLAKFTSFHALTAGTLALGARDRRAALVFGAAGFSVFLGGLLATQLASDGRFLENLQATAVAPEGHARSLFGALSTYALYVRLDHAFLLLIPPALLAIARRPAPTDLFRIYFVLHLVISIGFFFDTGAEYNHLIDLLAAVIILGSELLAPSAEGPAPARGLPDGAVVRLGALACFLGAGVLGLVVHHRDGWTSPERGRPAREVLEQELGLAGKTLLSHDPTVPVLLGTRPVVADDFQYRVMVMRAAINTTELPDRVRAGAFERIVLLNAPEPDPEDPRFEDRELGPHVARAIRERYALERRVGRFFVYAPRGDQVAR